MGTLREQSQLLVTGLVKEAKRFSLTDLLKMDIVETDQRLHACGSGDPKGILEPCRGILLTDIINRCKIITKGHNDTKKMYVVVSAADGYCTLFSWQELFNTGTGEGVLIILERGKKKLFTVDGRVDLLSARDFLSGPRYVKKVSTVELRMLGS